MTQPTLFQLDPCPSCRGRGNRMNHDLGWTEPCGACNGTGYQHPACRICGQPAPVHDEYCAEHDPETAPIPI